MNLVIDKNFIVSTLTELVRINSVNPGLVPDGPGEVQIGRYVSDTLMALGFKPRIQELEPKRVNVAAGYKGTGNGPSLMWNGHMDTVGVEGMSDPFSGEVRDGRVYGRGAQDMKGGIAAMLGAFKALKDNGVRLKGDIVFAAAADEEHRSIGTEALVEEFKPDAAIVTEPTDLNVCVAHRGFVVFEIETRGRAAHGSAYTDGIDANMFMGLCLAELFKHSKDLLNQKGHPLLGPPSLHVPLVKGGTGLFVYSEKCKISVERRTLPGEGQEALREEMEGILARVSDKEEAFRASLKPGLHREAYEISSESEIVRLVWGTAQQVLGKKPAFIGHPWWEDSALLAEKGTETVIFGPKGAGLHSHEEWVDIQSVVDLAEILVRVAVRFCG
ncbi:MAG: ArgE/DapE family deacylase [Candidatus Aminicenantes bacterium]|jgi:acetylornithine deacetylase